MKNLIACGSDLESLMPFLEKMDETFTVDSLVRNGEKVNVEAVYENKKLKVVKMYHNKEDVANSKLLLSKGKSNLVLSKCCKYWEALLSETHLVSKQLAVLAYMSTDFEKTPEGKIISRWVELDVDDMYYVDNETHLPKFKGYKMETSPEAYDLLMVNKIALKHGGRVYALSQEAMVSLLDVCQADSASYRQGMEESVLFVAGLLANNLSLKRKVSFAYRENEEICFITSIGGSRFSPSNPAELMTTIIKGLESSGKLIGCASAWEVYLDAVTVDVTLSSFNMWEKHLKITLSESSLVSDSLCAYIKVGDFVANLRTNKVTRSDTTKEQRLERLLEGIDNVFECFIDTTDEGLAYKMDKKMINAISLQIGKKRLDAIDLEEKEYTAFEIMRILGRANKQGKKMNKKQQGIFNNLCGEILLSMFQSKKQNVKSQEEAEVVLCAI